MKTGLVLEGGGMRGMYTAGVLDVFLDHQICLDGVMGVSAGAVFGVNYLSGQRGRVIRYNLRFNGDKNYMGLRPLLRSGNIVDTEFAYSTVPRELDIFDDEAFQASAVPFYAVVTTVLTGRAEYIRIRSVFEQIEALRASASLPFLSQPVLLDGQPYLDGGVADRIPYRKMLEMGYERLVVVLTRPEGFREERSRLPVELWYGRHPAFAFRLLHSHELYNAALGELRELEKAGTVFLLRPSRPIRMERLERDPDRLREVYEMGVEDCRARLEDLRAFLQGTAPRP